MMLRITVCNHYADLGRGRFGVVGYGHYLVSRFKIFAIEIER